MAYRTPGVFAEEISTLAPSVVPVSTAIPAFIGYTEKRPSSSIEAIRISSFKDFSDLFGGPFPEQFSATVAVDAANNRSYSIDAPEQPAFRLYYSLRMFYANGGGPCYIVSVGEYETDGGVTTPSKADLLDGLNALDKEDEPTLILFPDAPAVSKDDFYELYQQALIKCARLKDRFTIIDLHRGDQDFGLLEGVIQDFRNAVTRDLSYGAAYYPWLLTNLGFAYDASEVAITLSGTSSSSEIRLKYDTDNLNGLPDVEGSDNSPLGEAEKKQHYEERSLFHIDNKAYADVRSRIENFRVKLPPSGAVAGIYARIDNSRGVFKSPANVSLTEVIRPLVNIDDTQQAELNEHTSGKSINAIRPFLNRGVLIWGGRTLEGNSNEWRYISVRRFFLFAEESIKKAVENFVFEPNTESTWIKLRGLIENFLVSQWKAGALAGSTAEQAFYVQIGLGSTMTAVDILEGRLIIEIGMAVARPAEFIILKFTHKLPEA